MVQHADIDHTGITGVGGAITVENEGTPLATAATTLDFVGAGVTASGTGAEKTITIAGGSLPVFAANNVATDQSTTSTSATGLATAQTVTLTVNTQVLVTTGADAYMASGSAYIQTGFAMSGANTAAFDEQKKWRQGVDTNGHQGSRTAYLSGLTPGSTTFTFQVYTSGGTAHFRYRTLIVVCLD